jgi:branched-chain amino acid transport system permease protein
MKGYAPILGTVALFAAVPLADPSNVVLNFLILVLLTALAGQGWNLLGGYGGQYSFGHAAFFGTGAYVTAVLQARYGVNAWLCCGLGIAAAALLGAAIGALSFRSGLKGSYFALVTLAFAEVLRIAANAAPLTGAGAGTLIALDLRAAAFQFQSRTPFYFIVLGLVAISLVVVKVIEDSRFGAYLAAVRENEDAAQALGVNTTAVKIAAMTVSAAITAAGGCFYAQYFLFVNAGIAYGPWISVEALLAPIIGGPGTVVGPVLGALVVRTLGELGKLAAGDAPGLDLVIYGCVLIVVVSVAPHGIAGLLSGLRRRALALPSPVKRPAPPERSNG